MYIYVYNASFCGYKHVLTCCSDFNVALWMSLNMEKKMTENEHDFLCQDVRDPILEANPGNYDKYIYIYESL